MSAVQDLKKKIQKKKSEAGQALIEFVLVLILLMGSVLFLLQLGLVFGWANYIQYATYLSSRAYVSAGKNKADQKSRANTVIRRMVKRSGGGGDRIPFLARGQNGDAGDGVSIGEGPSFQPDKKDFSWLEGVRYSFRSRIFLMPLGSRNPADTSGGSQQMLELTSESWLGREPTEDECMDVMSKGKWIFDNGC